MERVLNWAGTGVKDDHSNAGSRRMLHILLNAFEEWRSELQSGAAHVRLDSTRPSSCGVGSAKVWPQLVARNLPQGVRIWPQLVARKWPQLVARKWPQI